MDVVSSVSQLQTIRRVWRDETVVLVPTMGALHPGHLSLIEKAKTLGTKVVVSIFVNPLQFGPNEDFTRYPRPIQRDLKLCELYQVDAVFVPDSGELYPNGDARVTLVVPPERLTNRYCGASRTGHFTGVATVVMNLFNIVQPDIAVFGEKDAQQLAVIRRMVTDLNLPVQITAAPTIREVDGLAKSSRNAYLKEDWQRRQARLLSRLLVSAQELYQQGVETTAELLSMAKDAVLDDEFYPDFDLEYFDAVDAESFEPVEVINDNTRLLVAAKISDVRLIDNAMIADPIRLSPSSEVMEAQNPILEL